MKYVYDTHCPDIVQCTKKVGMNSAYHCTIWNGEEEECDIAKTMEELKEYVKLNNRAPAQCSLLGKRVVYYTNYSPYDYLNHLAIEEGIDIKKWCGKRE